MYLPWVVQCSVTTDSQVDRLNIEHHVTGIHYLEVENEFIDFSFFVNRQTVALPREKLGPATVIECVSHLEPNAKPLYIPAYGFPHSHHMATDKIEQEMLEDEITEPSVSPWNASLLCLKLMVHFFLW